MRTGVLLAFFALLAAQPAQAAGWGQPGYEPQVRSLDRLLPEIRRSHPGRIYDAEGPFAGADGQMHYRLKWMTPEGRIVWLDADARSGRVTGAAGGREDWSTQDGGYSGRDYRSRGPEERMPERHFDNAPDYDRGRDYDRGGRPAWSGGDRGRAGGGDRGAEHGGDHSGGGDRGGHHHGGY